jgi:hypothetical protein
MSLQTTGVVVPQQLDYNSEGRMSQESKTTGFCNGSWAVAASYLYESKLLQYYYENYTSV